MLRQEEEVKREFLCIIPTIDTVKDIKSLRAISRTHNWVLDDVGPFGTDGIITSIHCENCGLERKAIHSNIEESRKKKVNRK